MGTTPSPLPSLADAITGAEQANTNYQNAVTQTQNDQTTATAAQQKADAAAQTVANDQTNQNTVAGTYVTALQTLVASANAEIANVTPPAPAPPPPSGS